MCSTFLPINGVLSACPPVLQGAEVLPLWTPTLVIDQSSPPAHTHKGTAHRTRLKSFRKICDSLLQGGV